MLTFSEDSRFFATSMRHLLRKPIRGIPVSFLKKAYAGLHDLELNLAVEKVGEV